MKNYFIILVLFWFSIPLLSAQALREDKIILKTNEIYTGEIVFQDEKVVIVRLPDGSRFQFPMDEIRTILTANQGDDSSETEINSNRVLLTLKTGQQYSGEIVLENEQILMIRASDGSRYQFPVGEIESIEYNSSADNNENYNILPVDNNKFVMTADVSFGLSHAGRAYGWAPSLQGALILGGKDIFIRNMFAGVGAGYNVILPSGYNNIDMLSFLPVFVRLQSTIGQKHVAPYVEMDGGYSFSLGDAYGGGLMLKVSAGVALRLSYRANLYLGVYGGIQNFSGNLNTSYNSHDYRYYGKTSMQNAGLKIALRF